MCPARVSALEAGVPEPVPAYTVNKACGSGMKATALGAQSIMLGEHSVIVSGGMESMNRVPYALDRARSGYRLGHGELRDLLVNGLTCPITNVHMGVTAENVATRHNLSRSAQDEYAAQSYAKAVAAQKRQVRADLRPRDPQHKGATRASSRRGRRDTPSESLAQDAAAFKKRTVTAATRRT